MGAPALRVLRSQAAAEGVGNLGAELGELG